MGFGAGAAAGEVSEVERARLTRALGALRHLTRGAAVLAVVALATGCTGGGSASQAASGAGFVAGDGTITVIEPAKRQAPVDLAGTTLDGERLDIASLRGRPVVINVWGSWCGPCRKEAPDLQAAHVRLGQSAAFVGINTREKDPAQAKAFERRFGVEYPSLVDDGGTLLLALRGAVAPKAIPTTLVLDGEGRIAARVTGATTQATLVGLVERVSGLTPGPSQSSSSPSPAQGVSS